MLPAQALIIGEECSRAKPFPDPYLKGLKVLGIEPQHAIVVEDSPSGPHCTVALASGQRLRYSLLLTQSWRGLRS